MTQSPKAKVLVLGDGDMASLAIVRSLGRAGKTVHLVSFEKNGITRRSRYARRVHRWPQPLENPEQFLARFFDLLAQEQFQLVVPTSDKTLVPLMQHREVIDRHSCFLAPTPEAFDVTNRKDRTVAIAREIGLAVPRTSVIQTVEEAHAFENEYQYPVVLKPISSMTPASTHRHNVRVVRSADEFPQRLPEMVRDIPVMVQEFCPGKGMGISVLAKDGELFAAFQHERVHEPPDGGASSYRKSVPIDESTLSLVAQFCKRIRWSGPAMFEFKLNSDRQPVLMEINGRFWGSLATAIKSGVDFPKLAYDLFVEGDARKTFEYRHPRFSRHTNRDFFWLIGNFRSKRRPNQLRLGFGDLFKELGNVVLLRERYDIESITDPLPMFVSWFDIARQLGGAVKSKVSHRRQRKRAESFARKAQRRPDRIRSQIQRSKSFLFLCYGNINRSLVAERAFKKICNDQLKCESAGFFEREGRGSSVLSEEVAASLAIDITNHRSQTVTAEMMSEFDTIVTMDHDNLIRVEALDPRAMEKVIPLAAVDESDDRLEILDPHGRDREAFEQAYQQILSGVRAMARHID